MYVLIKVMGVLGFEIANNLDIFGQHLQNSKEIHQKRIAVELWLVESKEEIGPCKLQPSSQLGTCAI